MKALVVFIFCLSCHFCNAQLKLVRDSTLPIPEPVRFCPANTDTERQIFDDIKYHINDDFFRLMKKGVNINLRDEKTCATLVTWSVTHMNIEVFKYLLANGADYISYDHWGNPACAAALWGRTEFLQILLDKGISPDTRTVFGSTLLHFAVSEGKFETVKLLIKYKARMDIKDEDGDTVLEKAKKRKLDEMVKILEEAGAK